MITVYAAFHHKPEPDLAFRVQTDLEKILTDTTREVSSGPRNAAPLQFIDEQQRRFGPIMFFRVRKTIG